MTLHFLKYLTESTDQREVYQNKLNFDRKELEPVMSEDTLKYHYDGLASKYFDRYNKGEGDPDFNYGGAMLHNIFFGNLTPPRAANKPTGISNEIIEKKYSSFEKFKEAFEKEFMAAQGSNWIYLSRSGQIKTIRNHQKRTDIILLIDWWEHAWSDYGSDKKKYFDNIWRIMNWETINRRIYTGKT